MANGRFTKRESRLINLWVPSELFPVLDQAVRSVDSDRSKFIRTAIREKIERTIRGGSTPQPA